AKGISIWLKADFDVLMKRIRRRHDRPLLKTDDPGATLRRLMEERDPTYALADITVQSRDVLHDKIVDEIVSALAGQLGTADATTSAPAQGDRRPGLRRCAPAIRSSLMLRSASAATTSSSAAGSWRCWGKKSSGCGRGPWLRSSATKRSHATTARRPKLRLPRLGSAQR